jgi:hypothetical protein
MIQVHLWIPTTVHIEDWENKINTNLNNLATAFPLLEFGPLQVHARHFIFNAAQLKTQLDEAIFIPVCRQLHIIILTDYDVYPEDPHRVVDELVHIDSIARLTRRIQVLVFDNINTNSSILKNIPTQHIKTGFQTLSSVTNSKISTGNSEDWLHDYRVDFNNCPGCETYIRASITAVLLKLTSDLFLATFHDDPRPHLGTR